MPVEFWEGGVDSDSSQSLLAKFFAGPYDADMRKMVRFGFGRPGGAAGRVTITLVLALVLLVGLACAQLLVYLRGGFGRAVEAGTLVLKDVAQKGLDTFLGRQPLMRYYLLQEGGQNVGFALSIVEPEINKEGAIIYRGRELVIHENTGERREYAFSLANDLSWYQYSDVVHAQGRKAIMGNFQDYRQGRLECKVLDAQGRFTVIPVSKNFNENLVCPPMVDFFSSLVLSREAAVGGVFSVAQIMDLDVRGHLGMAYMDIWVSAGKDVPEEIKALVPGREAQTHWSSQGADLYSQSIYYDMNHQLVWQLDHVKSPQVRRQVAQEELRHLYPQAQSLLDGWQEPPPEEEKPEPESKEFL